MDNAPTLEALREAARSEDPHALWQLATALVMQHEVEEAFELHVRAAARGHAPSQVELGRMHLYGVGTSVDTAAAIASFEAAEARGSIPATYFLALIGLGDHALQRDARINTRLQACVDAGFVPALRAAAVHFGRRDDPRDQARSLELLDAAAARGDAVAALLLVERLRHGEGMPPDPARAAALGARLAQAGHPPLPDVGRARQADTGVSLPPGHLALEESMLVPVRTALSAQPAVHHVDGVLSADERRLVIAVARPQLRRSQAVDPATGVPVHSALRTSADAVIDPVGEDMAMRLVQLRIAQAAGTPLVHAEHMTVLRYGPGQQYRPHRDYLPASIIDTDGPEAGNRTRTVFVYLNTVDAGGATEFPVPGVRVEPVPGRAVVFDNLHADGTPDPDSLHAGTPVERGEKWLATLWLRERAYRRY